MSMQPEHRAQPGSQSGGWGSGQPTGQPTGQPSGQPVARQQAGQPTGSSAGQGGPAMTQPPPVFPPQAAPQTSSAPAPSSQPTSSRVTVPGYPSGPAAPAEEKVDTGPLPSRETLRREARAASSRRGAGDADVERAGVLLKSVADIFSQRVVGQEQLRTALVTSLMSSGHILLESVPGLAKTTAAQTLASAVSGSFRRIQCTPDLMPNDIVGTQILNSSTGEMTTQLGPVHANIVLLDEINRSSAKTQSAMLEAMQERQTSIGGVVYPLPHPFMVLATQNPIEEEGTYVLPEAQMDRFLMKEVLTYPRPSEEADVLDRISNGSFDKPVTGRPISTDDVEWLQRAAERVYVDPVIKQYIVALINTSRGGGPRPVPGLDRQVRVGASPRGGIALMKVAQAVALQEGRTYVIPDDVRLLRHGVLRHRLVLTYDALADGIAPEAIIDAIFAAVPTP
ncbi:AAA family ATPase [Actinomyces naeslundii]|uniref:AAA family ATPase n=2 Tax=Actinomyces naeslundii TaxID=1655 RepID=A0AA47IR15_ACTNA|nr:MoxR family ATPase [Actinomyces naeslundii]OMG12383.1 AAA family ATPase [Actinomyces naeslundii]OMG15261.1 AAA family ATPase [Actinomyces naeslundii]OMG22508.1 AAA family ATPase [Actinomyces naeslundii]PKY96263.1 AAA family ATPase [Actinomyces naeslundii]WAL43894.1 AAA family ATPase [Actinomyces naeslundii]